MIEYASQEYKKQQNLRFIVMDASKNIFRDQFDIIISFNCLHWIKDQHDTLRGIYNAAVCGAQIALLLSHKKSLYHLILDKICSNAKWKEYFITYESPRLFFTTDEYKGMLINVGLEVIELSEEEMTYLFKSKEQLKDFIYAAGAQIKQIPEHKKSDFLNDFVIEYLAASECQNHLIPVSFWCLHVIAVKSDNQ